MPLPNVFTNISAACHAALAGVHSKFNGGDAARTWTFECVRVTGASLNNCRDVDAAMSFAAAANYQSPSGSLITGMRMRAYMCSCVHTCACLCQMQTQLFNG